MEAMFLEAPESMMKDEELENPTTTLLNFQVTSAIFTSCLGVHGVCSAPRWCETLGCLRQTHFPLEGLLCPLHILLIFCT